MDFISDWMIWVYFISFVLAWISAEDTHAKHYLDQTMPTLPISKALILVTLPGVNTLYALWYLYTSLQDLMCDEPVILDISKDTRGFYDTFYP